MKRPSITAPADRSETTDRLLDAAERLFGKHGYDGVGMRALAEEAMVNLGATTYHFGSKEALYIETVMRRLRPNNTEQLRLLREAQTQAPGQPLAVETIVVCLMRPAYSLALAHPNFNALLARNLLTPPLFLRTALRREMEPKVQEFTSALRQSLPDLPGPLIRIRVLFSTGCLLMFSTQVGQMPAEGKSELRDFLFEELVRFVSAGIQSEPVGAAAAAAAAARPPIPRPSRQARQSRQGRG